MRYKKDREEKDSKEEIEGAFQPWGAARPLMALFLLFRAAHSTTGGAPRPTIICFAGCKPIPFVYIFHENQPHSCA